MRLYNYFRSSASFRVRIALSLKGLEYDYVSVHLAKGEHQQGAYRTLLPDALVPLLETEEGPLVQSMAIIEYLEETHPNPALLPSGAYWRSRVRALAQSVACEIHPLNNLRVLKYLVGPMQVSPELKDTWYHHWVRDGLQAFERQLLLLDEERVRQGMQPSRLCFGDTPTMADCLLVPQIFNAQRFNVSLEGLPRTMAAFEACMQLDAFVRAQPSSCPDFEA